MKRFLLITLSALFVVSCGPKTEQAEITFLGISSGTLKTPLNELAFKDKFNIDETNLVAVVAFGESVDETDVQATWFSPDDRRMPLGRKSITMESGATIARFSFATRDEWQKSPFMLDIRTKTGEGEESKTSSGQLHFFVGLEEKQIVAYNDEYNAYKEHEADKRKMYALKKEKEEKAKTIALARLGGSVADIGHRYDVNGDGQEELIIIDPPSDEPFMGATETGAVFSADVKKFSISNLSGSTVLETIEEGGEIIMHGVQGPLATSFKEGKEIHLVLYPDSVTIEWDDKELVCKQIFKFDKDWVNEGEGVVCE
ncbi:MAG: hypothetical protein QF755_01875 [Candidatus Peribacteraceae bacterium]|jgi:transcriptional regulator of NAD metabolism|nr:hypothetical protein [Candidatus Peribacteraceae bacterium]HCI03886.1 hypothetical protein [Candidatus Peribacteria bacterium]|tara:strand:- start:2059 stop:3000 length:942 start_codon:yes stop_codon:yes gene_type:complete